MRVDEKFYLEQIWNNGRRDPSGMDADAVPLPDDSPGLTADQNAVEELGEAFGLPYEMGEELHCGEKEFERDRHRWELDPASSEDYGERNRTSAGWRWRHFNH